MTNNPLLLDGVIAAVIALVVLIVTPGAAIAGLVAVVALLVCGAGRWRDRHAARRPAPVRRRAG